ncbi:MAG: dienelactone hydrolase family protein, partial [Thermomicrobiales bacterium]
MIDKDTNAGRRQELFDLLGDLPDRNRAISIVSRARHEHPRYGLEEIVLDLNGVEHVPAFFAHPKEGSGPWPTVLYNHAHGGDYALGKEELLQGRSALQPPPYAEELTGLGYAALCFDSWAFGQRATISEGDRFKLMLWRGQVLWGMMLFDSIRAVDYLTSRDDVDSDRIGTLGLSMGSTMAWWLAALDTRVAVCVDLCCLTAFDALIVAGDLRGHGVYYYVPRLLKPFSTARINALIAPRPHLALAGNNDRLTPPRGLDRIDAALHRADADAGAPPGAWRISPRWSAVWTRMAIEPPISSSPSQV